MTKPILTTLLTCLLVGKSGYSAERFRLEKLWELDAAKLTHERSPLPGGHPVHSLSFSPDGRWLAVVMDDHGPKSAVRSHILILDSKEPDKDPISVDLSAAQVLGFGGFEASWSPQSNLVLASGTLVNLSGRVICSLPAGMLSSRFLGSSSIVSQGRTPYEPGRGLRRASVFLLIDKTCSPRPPWEVPGGWHLSDANPETGIGLITLNHVSVGEVRSVDFASRTIGPIIGRRDEDGQRDALFANGGKVVCKADGIDGRGHSPAECFDVASGKLLGEAPVNGGWPMVTAAHSPRVVFTDWRYQPYIIMDGGAQILRKRIVWDFETKEEIVTWGSGNQRYLAYSLVPSREDDWRKKPFAVALSADGTLVAEGGEGLIRLYSIQPVQSK